MSVLRKDNVSLSFWARVVSILILMDVCLKEALMIRRVHWKPVSILILMDVCLKGASVEKSLCPFFGFNPYFNGCLS